MRRLEFREDGSSVPKDDQHVGVIRARPAVEPVIDAAGLLLVAVDGPQQLEQGEETMLQQGLALHFAAELRAVQRQS